MQITHSYLGTARNDTKCLFFVLYEDYIDAQSDFARELDRELERFARNLGDKGVVVRSFEGDIETTRIHVLDKNWTQNQKREIQKTPSMLMINVDFDLFDPQKHPWFLLNLGERISQNISVVREFRQVFQNLVEAISRRKQKVRATKCSL